VKPASLA